MIASSRGRARLISSSANLKISLVPSILFHSELIPRALINSTFRFLSIFAYLYPVFPLSNVSSKVTGIAIFRDGNQVEWSKSRGKATRNSPSWLLNLEIQVDFNRIICFRVSSWWTGKEGSIIERGVNEYLFLNKFLPNISHVIATFLLIARQISQILIDSSERILINIKFFFNLNKKSSLRLSMITNFV